MTPTTFGRYQILNPLGSGGMADVYLAHDPTLGRQVAIKSPRLRPESLARFNVEARAIARLEHPAIVPLYEYGNSDGRPYLVMRHMRGGSLADRLARGPLPAPEALAILSRIAEALDYAHSRGVIHRDVKPGNILFDENGRAFLSDFGIARLEDAQGPRLTVQGAAPGSPAYLSPEQARGDHNLDGRSDIFSLGVVAYQMLAGRLPFPLGPAQASLGVPPLAQARPDLPPAVQPALARALAPDPNARYRHAAEFVGGLGRALGGRAAGGRAGSAAGRPVSPWLIGGVVVALALAFVWMLTRGGGAPTAGTIPRTPTRPTISDAVAETDLQTILNEGTQSPASAPTATAAGATATDATALTLSPAATATLATESVDLSSEQVNETYMMGRTSLGTPIVVNRIGDGPQKIFLVGGITGGYAPGTEDVAIQAEEYYRDNPEAVPPEVTLYIIAVASPDTPRAPGEYRGRLNANGVDINRNWDCNWARDSVWDGQLRSGNGGSAPFSELESRLLRTFIEHENPVAVIIWYARAQNGLVSPGGCGASVLVSEPLAELYGQASGYRVQNIEELRGITINGDATNYLDARGIPAISVLLPNFSDPDWQNNLNGIQAVIDHYAQPGAARPQAGGPTTAVPAAPPPPTAAPAAPAAPCLSGPGDRWADTLWDLYANRLICARNQPHTTLAAYQKYQNGIAVWREDIDRVYFLYNDRTYATYPGNEAPQGYHDTDLLKGAFGYLWNTYPAVRDRLGRPQEPEANAGDFVIQDFEGGVLFYFFENGAYNYALFNSDRTWVGIQE